MAMSRPQVSFGVVLAAGVALGWGLAGMRPAAVLANGADRWGERALVAGPVAIEMMTKELASPLDAIYYLNYSTGKLLATIPTFQQTGGQARVLNDFAERDLIADFAIKPGADPHFLMTTGSLGMNGAGWSPLFVIETESGQIATYKVAPQATPGSTRPTFQMVDRRVDRRLGKAMAASASR